jgi:predicted ester cyclase
MGQQEDVAVFRRVIEQGFGEGRLDVIDDLLGPNFVEHQGDGEQSAGPERLKQAITILREAFPDLRATVEDAVGEGEKIAFRVRFEGTNSGDLLGQRATGQTARWEAMDICRFDAGRMVEHWGVVDRFGVMEQLGALPAPARGALTPR